MHLRSHRGFTLIEVMVVVAMVAILTAIALPSYAAYIKRSRARAAGADLLTLSLNLENAFQLTLKYPDLDAGTTATTTLFSGWAPTQTQFFSYTVGSSSAKGSYTLGAQGSGTLDGCTLTLDSAGVKTATSSCGFSSW